MIGALAVLALLQQAATGPMVMVSVDRDRLIPGEVLNFTIRVTSDLTDPIRVDLPSLGGFELEARSEHSDVTPGPRGGRTTVYELRLRATTPGEWRLGPVTARQGAALAQADPVDVTIEGGTPSAVAAALNPRLARLVERAPAPGVLGPAAITVLVSDTTVVVGEQVDLVTLAWFERGVRLQLRRAPTVESPHIDGVWAYQQPVPGGIAASRQVGGKWYDIFVLHQVAFPLSPGEVTISPARLQYSVPLAFQFFSQEERYTLSSEATRFGVRTLPDAGREPGFTGAVGHGLVLRQEITPASGHQGEAFNAELALSGEGNVALWPQPDVRWPAGVRVYPEAAGERTTVKDGRLGGTKTFKYLIVADSAGTLAVPAVHYPFFDPTTGRYAATDAAALELVVAPRGTTAASRAEPPPIRMEERRAVATAIRSWLPDWAWLLIGLAPLLALVPWPRRRHGLAAPVARSRAADPLADAERRLAAGLRALGAGPGDWDHGALEVALIQAGLDANEARLLSDLRERLRRARFAGDPAAQSALVGQVDAALNARGASVPAPGRRWRERAGLASLLLLALLSRRAGAQAAPEELYQAGAYRAAAAGFRLEATTAPDITSYWFNLGAAAWRAGDDAQALAAWTRAARLAPRDGAVARGLGLVPPADGPASTALWVSPLSPDELWLIGLLVWLVGVSGWVVTRRLRGRWVVLIGGGVLFLAASVVLDRWYSRPLAIVMSNGTLRLSPHELAPAVGEVSRLGTVRPEVRRGDWVQVEASGGQRGWLRQEDLAALQPERSR